MSTTTEDRSTTPSGSELSESVMDGSNSLTVVLKNLTTTLSQLSEASQAQTAALADLKEDLLQDDAAEPNPDRPTDSLDITQITAVVSDCTRDSGTNTNATNNMASESHSDSESQGHNSIVESLTQAYLPNTAIEGKIATSSTTYPLVASRLTRSKRAPTNIHHRRMSSVLTSQVSMKRCEICSHVGAERWI